MSEDALAHLAQACDPASFGRNGEDVHDESYRKAGKLDRGAFAVDLDLEKSGLMDVIRHNLLDAKNSQNAIRAELYKLNVYGTLSVFLTRLLCLIPPHRGGIVLQSPQGYAS